MAAAVLALLLMGAPDAATAPPSSPPTTVTPLAVQPAPARSPDKPDVKLDMGSGPDDDSKPDFVSIWPVDAYNTGVDGRVTLACLVDPHGLAEQCNILSERPANVGLGKAALLLRPTFKLAPAQGPDGPIAATMTIGVTFKNPIRNTFQQRMRLAPAVTMLDHPIWLAAPSFDDLAHVYPAKGAGAEGYVVDHCRVGRSGALDRCAVVKESPRGEGFGAAGLGLAARFRLADNLPRPPHGEELWVDIPIRMTPAATEARTVMAPTWLSGIDPAKPPKLFPPEAIAKGLTSGRGVARCTVAADGALTACVPDPAEPADSGFSVAAAKLASTLKINLWSADGAPVEGGVIRVPIRLELPRAPG